MASEALFLNCVPAYLTRGSPAAVVAGRLEMYARSMIILTFGGGTNEVLRDVIAQRGYGMPSYGR